MAVDLDRHWRLAKRAMQAWTDQDVEKVLACYTEDLVYLDPNTRGPIEGREAMRAYLTKLFGRWVQTWEATEIFPLEGRDGTAVRWHATLAKQGDPTVVEIDGVDLVLLEGDLIKRNEVYFDRALLAPLVMPEPAVSK